MSFKEKFNEQTKNYFEEKERLHKLSLRNRKPCNCKNKKETNGTKS